MNMHIEKITKPAFTVIGRLGSTSDGEGFIARLWQDANSRFGEIESLVKRDENGVPAGFWGAMSDMSLSFMPWEEGFTKGLYLAGAEVYDDAEAPEGWTKWVIPAYEYIYAEQEDENTFRKLMAYMFQKQLSMVGAAQDFTDPKTGKCFVFIPIRKI